MNSQATQVKVLLLDAANARAEVEIPLELALPQHEIHHSSALKKLCGDEKTMRRIKVLEKRGYEKALTAFLRKKLVELA